MFPQRFSDPIARFGYADQETRRDTPPLDRRPYAVVVWLSLNV